MMEHFREMTDTISSLRAEITVLKTTLSSYSTSSQHTSQTMEIDNPVSSSPPTPTTSYEEI